MIYKMKLYNEICVISERAFVAVVLLFSIENFSSCSGAFKTSDK